MLKNWYDIGMFKLLVLKGYIVVVVDLFGYGELQKIKSFESVFRIQFFFNLIKELGLE